MSHVCHPGQMAFMWRSRVYSHDMPYSFTLCFLVWQHVQHMQVIPMIVHVLSVSSLPLKCKAMVKTQKKPAAVTSSGVMKDVKEKTGAKLEPTPMAKSDAKKYMDDSLSEKTLDLGFWDSASEPDHGKERGCKEEPKDKDS